MKTKKQLKETKNVKEKNLNFVFHSVILYVCDLFKLLSDMFYEKKVNNIQKILLHYILY